MKEMIIIKVLGYARVSTNLQARDGNSLEAQEKLLLQNGATEIYKDKYTGVKNDRLQLRLLLEKLQEGDTLLVTKLDRVARSVKEGTELIETLLERNIIVNILNLGILSNTATGQLIRNILLSIAQFERDMIMERTAEGKAIAKLDPNFKEGRPKKFTAEQLNHAMGLLDNYSYKKVERMTRISISTLTREKRTRNNINKHEKCEIQKM